MKIVAATGNKGKLAEFQRMLTPLGIEVLSQQEAGGEIEVDETGETFQENAMLKASAIFKHTGLPTIADDSGLCVDALQGRPGVHSARYCGEETPHSEKIVALLKEMKDVPEQDRTARFVAHITCIIDEHTILECEGVCEGMIGFEAAGTGGFGFDPVFYVNGRSFGQLSAEEKDKVSHRGKALRELYRKLEQYQK